MSRSDPGAASGGPVREPGRCVCGALEPLHTIVRSGQRGGCPATGCTRYERASNVVELFPGAGTTPAPAGPPTRTVDLDGVADRYTDLLDARYRNDTETVRLLEAALADDAPVLLDLIHHLTQVRGRAR